MCKVRLTFFYRSALIAILFFCFQPNRTLAADKGVGFRLGAGLGGIEVRQQIPASGSNINADALEVSLFNISYQYTWSSKLQMALYGGWGRALFISDGAVRVGDVDISIYDANLEARWQLGAGSWSSQKSFAPYMIYGLQLSGLPVFVAPQVPTALHELDRIDAWMANVGIGTGVYFWNIAMIGTAKLHYPFASNSDFDVSRGYGLSANLGTYLTIGQAGEFGLEIYKKYLTTHFDAVNLQTAARGDNRYSIDTLGARVIYTYIF